MSVCMSSITMAVINDAENHKQESKEEVINVAYGLLNDDQAAKLNPFEAKGMESFKRIIDTFNLKQLTSYAAARKINIRDLQEDVKVTEPAEVVGVDEVEEEVKEPVELIFIKDVELKPNNFVEFQGGFFGVVVGRGSNLAIHRFDGGAIDIDKLDKQLYHTGDDRDLDIVSVYDNMLELLGNKKLDKAEPSWRQGNAIYRKDAEDILGLQIVDEE